MANLIGPDQLEADAVIPQCLDNQFVSERAFAALIARGVDFDDPDVSALREQDFKTEFIRSLVYSSQVIIQRAFFRNNKVLFHQYNGQDGKNLAAFAKLMREGAIVPYLFKESSLRDDLDFGLSTAGDQAMQSLLGEVGDEVSCVRLAIDDATNERIAATMAADFGARLTRLAHMDGTQINAMAAELFAQPERLQEAGASEAFNEAVLALARFAFQTSTSGQGRVARQDVYRENFAAGRKDENVVLGRFERHSTDRPFLFELKKYVDLVYNTNLPDRLNRYTFTPMGMPSRMALQDAPGHGFDHNDMAGLLAEPEALEHLRRTFISHTQKGMQLPLLANLSISDVAEVRSLPEWEAFKEAQLRILRDPLRCLHGLESFEKAFDEFQRALSDWYNLKYRRAETEAKYCSFISLVLSVAGKLFAAGTSQDPLVKAALGVGIDHVIPKRVKGYAAKLMVGVYDIEQRRLDAERTYTIELMQTAEELTREDVKDLIRSCARDVRGDVELDPRGAADQGIK